MLRPCLLFAEPFCRLNSPERSSSSRRWFSVDRSDRELVSAADALTEACLARIGLIFLQIDFSFSGDADTLMLCQACTDPKVGDASATGNVSLRGGGLGRRGGVLGRRVREEGGGCSAAGVGGKLLVGASVSSCGLTISGPYSKNPLDDRVLDPLGTACGGVLGDWRRSGEDGDRNPWEPWRPRSPGVGGKR